MGQKQVRICDRCGTEKIFFSTTDWTVVKISLPMFEGKEQSKEYDLCNSCTNQFRTWVVSYAHAATTNQINSNHQ